MHLVIDNPTRFFSVVGAPYIPESHSDDRCEQRGVRRDDDLEPAFVPSAAATGWWPQACR